MGYASQAGRARTSSKSPRAHAICDRCGFRYNFEDLQWQFDWRGAMLMNLYVYVCDRCLDTPQEQLRAIILPPDPEPIIYARPELYAQDSTTYMTQSPSTIDPTTGIPIPNMVQMTTLSGTFMGPQPIGPTANPRSDLGLELGAQMPLVKDLPWAQPVPFLSIVANGTTVIAVSCSQSHGLATGAQIAVEGTSAPEANGFFNVTVTGGTTFTYETNRPVQAGSILGSNVDIVTANAGVPWNFDGYIPRTGI